MKDLGEGGGGQGNWPQLLPAGPGERGREGVGLLPECVCVCVGARA